MFTTDFASNIAPNTPSFRRHTNRMLVVYGGYNSRATTVMSDFATLSPPTLPSSGPRILFLLREVLAGIVHDR